MIQLSWSLCNVRISQDDIRKQLAQYEQEGNPAVWEVMESLYPREHKVIDSETSTAGPGASLASLKRTKADIQHREIMFQGVPGLHFIIQRQGRDWAKRKFRPLGWGPQGKTVDKQKQSNPFSVSVGSTKTYDQNTGAEAYDSPTEESAKIAAREAENKVFPSLTRVSDLATISDHADPEMMFSDFAMVADMESSGARKTAGYPEGLGDREEGRQEAGNRAVYDEVAEDGEKEKEEAESGVVLPGVSGAYATDEADLADEDSMSNDFTSDHEDNVERSNMEQMVVDLLGK